MRYRVGYIRHRVGYIRYKVKDTQQMAFRLPKSLIKRLDAHVARLRKDQPGMTVSRADAVRVLLSRALDEEDQRGIKR